eukprot:697135-Amphidinium_carterae.1
MVEMVKMLCFPEFLSFVACNGVLVEAMLNLNASFGAKGFGKQSNQALQEKETEDLPPPLANPRV